jgi:PAS domain S-box-containing protein
MIKSPMSYDSLAMEPPGVLSQEGYYRGPDIVAFRFTAAHWALLAALAALYVLAGKLGLHFAFVHASATAVWPPTGIALAAFLLFGPRVWPAVAVGAFLVNVTTAGSVATSLGVATGNTLEGLLSAWLVNRFAHGRYAFERAQDIFAFVVAVVPGALVSATMGVASLALGGYALWAGFGPIWATWWLGDITGALIVAPPLLLWADRRSSLLLRHPVEAACLLLSIALGGYAVFGGLSPLGPRHPLAILCLPPLVWAAFRFGRRAAATAILLLSGIALYGTVKGFGPFAVAPADSLLMLQTFLATMAVMTLSMAALVWVRDRESALLQTIIDRIPAMISVYEPNTKVLRLNQEFKRLTGLATAEARQVDLMAESYPNPAYRAKIRAYMDTLPDGWHDVDMSTKDGQVIATSWTNVRLADDTRVGIGLDVRERKRVEGERERAQAEAEAAGQAKDEFFAMLGHELRNPLGVITTALRILEVTGPLDERNEKARQIVSRQVVILVRLVDDLLDITRLTTGKIVLSSSPVNLGAAAQRAVTAVAAGAPDQRIACHAVENLWIQADETRLEQILMNLLHNAVKFTPGDGRVLVAVMGEGPDAVLRVEDTGAGIPADLLPRIFDLFVQGQTGLHRAGAGLGIGLTLVKRLVDLHKGRIDVTSAGPGRGSAFTVRFPRIEPVASPPAAKPAPVTGQAPRRILIVEDNDDARQMLRHLLELLGHEVHEAEDGVRGLEQALVLRPDAAVIDLGLPRLDGYQVAQRIRAAGRRDVVLIAVTGYGQREDRLRSSAAGFDAHLTKPVDPTALDALLQRHPPV